LGKFADFFNVFADSSKMSTLTGCCFKFHRRFFNYFLIEMRLSFLFFYFSPISCTFPLIFSNLPLISKECPPIFPEFPLIPEKERRRTAGVSDYNAVSRGNLAKVQCRFLLFLSSADYLCVFADLLAFSLIF